MLKRTLLLASVLSPALALVAGDSAYTPLLTKLQESGQRYHIGVACDYSFSRDEVQAVANEIRDGSRLTVVDLRTIGQMGAAFSALNRESPDLIVLLERDRIVAPGTFATTYLIQRLNLLNKPTLATTRQALDQGAFAALGTDTNFEWVVNPDIPAGSVELVGARSINGGGSGGAQMNVISLR